MAKVIRDPGRPRKRARFIVQLVEIRDGKRKHMLSVVSYRTVTELLKGVQSLEGGDWSNCPKCKANFDRYRRSRCPSCSFVL